MLSNLKKRIYLRRLERRGLVHGENLRIEKGVILDSSFPWLLEIGNNVIIAPYAHILCHDASTKPILGYTKIGRVIIGNNVFIGAKAIILPNINIGDNVIIGAGSIVTKDIQNNCVVAGNPAKVLCKTDEYIEKNKIEMKNKKVYDIKYTIKGKIDKKRKEEMKEQLIQEGKKFII